MFVFLVLLCFSYERSIDIVYESVGGEFFDICVNALATKGVLIVIGYIAGLFIWSYMNQYGVWL